MTADKEIASNSVPKLVTMEDGTECSFGSRARLISEQTFTETGFTVLFKLVSGAIIKYVFDAGAPISRLALEMAAFGAASKAKASTASSKTIDEIEVIVRAKVQEFENQIFVTRGGPSNSLALTMTQEAYCNVNGLDAAQFEIVAQVKEDFAKLSKEDKSTLVKSPAMRVAIGTIQLRHAQAELSAQIAEEEAGK